MRALLLHKLLPTIACGAVVGLGLGLLSACHQETRAPQDARPPIAAQPATAPTWVPDAASVAPPVEKNRATGMAIDAQGIRLDNDARILVPLGAGPSFGADAAYKRSGPNDLYLVPLADALKREVAAGRISKPLRLVAASTTPYRALMEALFTAGQCEIGSFELCEESCDKRKLSFEPPRASQGHWDPSMPRKLNLVAIVVSDGVGLKASGGNLAPGCNDIGPGLTVPRVGAALDLASVASCVAKLKGADPAYTSEDQATIVANPHTPLREVMDVALTLRTQFPKIMFGVPR
ncbi:MAG: hypothetical protein HY898_24165 [Deltaproteobacteria bacterium]|nr:hypothetical protein [Deltaproteobacteria bacterium]